jgi:hypothetical protein
MTKMLISRDGSHAATSSARTLLGDTLNMYLVDDHKLAIMELYAFQLMLQSLGV